MLLHFHGIIKPIRIVGGIADSQNLFSGHCCIVTVKRWPNRRTDNTHDVENKWKYIIWILKVAEWKYFWKKTFYGNWKWGKSRKKWLTYSVLYIVIAKNTALIGSIANIDKLLISATILETLGKNHIFSWKFESVH